MVKKLLTGPAYGGIHISGEALPEESEASAGKPSGAFLRQIPQQPDDPARYGARLEVAPVSDIAGLLLVGARKRMPHPDQSGLAEAVQRVGLFLQTRGGGARSSSSGPLPEDRWFKSSPRNHD